MFGLFRNSSRDWCCAGFKGNYGQAGHRGISVLIERCETLGTRFLIQYRAVDRADQEQFHSSLENVDFHVSVVIETGMTFCPWCGVDLKRFYGKRTEQLDRPGFSIPLR